jgi:transposase-like protein
MPINPNTPFKSCHYPGEVIVLCVRWYLRYPLSYLHVSELVAERGAGLYTRAEQTLPTAPEADEQELSNRRDLY